MNDAPPPPAAVPSRQVQHHLRAAHEAAARVAQMRRALHHRRLAEAGAPAPGPGAASDVVVAGDDDDVDVVVPPVPAPVATLGERAADTAATIIGSWRFLIIQTLVLGAWVVLNVVAWTHRWDPYPFILLNLALSFQAAYSAPVLLMSSNRQADVDREHAAKDYLVNERAEAQVEELLHLVQAQLQQNAEILALLQTASGTPAPGTGTGTATVEGAADGHRLLPEPEA